MGDLLASRCRRDLAVPGRADRRAVPAVDPRDRPAQRRSGQGQAVLRVAVAARGRGDGLVHEPRPVLVLRVLRDRARADVLPDRWVGLRGPCPRGHQVLPVHDDRLGVHARVDHGHRLHRQSQRGRPRHVRPRRDRRERRLRGVDRALVVLRVRGRVRREGADLPAPHVAARCPHPGADRRFGRAGRCDAEARHVRLAAVRAVPVPRGVVVEPPPVARRWR